MLDLTFHIKNQNRMYPQSYLEFVNHFNRAEYRACVEPLEVLWFAQRDDFHKALIRLVVGLNQINLGLESGPRFLLGTARTLLQPYHPAHNGLDLVALDGWIASREAQLAAGTPVAVPPLVLRLDPPPAADV
jgi:hypothetical protein